jgi:hypothetical protein
MMGTHWEKGQKQKIPVFPPLKKRKNWIVRECMLSLPIGGMKLVFPKLFIPIFCLG